MVDDDPEDASFDAIKAEKRPCYNRYCSKHWHWVGETCKAEGID